jgi:single-stranded DNA-binding protein
MTTAFINVTAWGKLAEYLGTYYKKGDEIYIEGEIRNSDYKTGDKVLQTNYILISTVKATYGQKSRRQAAEVELASQAEELEEQVEKPRRRRKAEPEITDDSE